MLAICKVLRDAGYEAVLAGGCVRDALLGKVASDLDVATSASPEQIQALFPRHHAVGKTFGVIAVVTEDGEPIDVATYRTDGSYSDGRRPDGIRVATRSEDAKRRDFTMNALYFDPLSEKVLDEVGGTRDIKARVIRVVGEPEKRFAEDKLRLLRAVRFQAQLGFTIESEAARTIAELAPTLAVVSRERVRDEVDKLLASDRVQQGVQTLFELGLAKIVFGDWFGDIDAAFAAGTLGKKLAAAATQAAALDVRRLLLFSAPLLRRTAGSDEPAHAVREIRAQLGAWKYGRSFIEKAVWLSSQAKALSAPSEADPFALVQRDKVEREFDFSLMRAKQRSAAEKSWIDSLEVWIHPLSPDAIETLDRLVGTDLKRGEALARRGLAIGGGLPAALRAEDLNGRLGQALSGPRLGEALREINRELMARTTAS